MGEFQRYRGDPTGFRETVPIERLHPQSRGFRCANNPRIPATLSSRHLEQQLQCRGIHAVYPGQERHDRVRESRRWLDADSSGRRPSRTVASARHPLGTNLRYLNTPSATYGDILVDGPAKQHPELRHVVSAIPDSVRLKDMWMLFSANVRPLEGVSVLSSFSGAFATRQIPFPDSNGTYPYVWAARQGWPVAFQWNRAWNGYAFSTGYLPGRQRGQQALLEQPALARRRFPEWLHGSRLAEVRSASPHRRRLLHGDGNPSGFPRPSPHPSSGSAGDSVWRSRMPAASGWPCAMSRAPWSRTG